MLGSEGFFLYLCPGRPECKPKNTGLYTIDTTLYCRYFYIVTNTVFLEKNVLVDNILTQPSKFGDSVIIFGYANMNFDTMTFFWVNNSEWRT